MVSIESFPHHNARYENDERQATLVFLLLDALVVLLAVPAIVLVLAYGRS